MYNNKALLLINYTYFVDIGQNRGKSQTRVSTPYTPQSEVVTSGLIYIGYNLVKQFY